MKAVRKRSPKPFAGMMAIWFLLGNSWPVLAQLGEAPAGVLQLPRVASKEVMERPIALWEGAGPMHQKVSTTSSEAQSYYDQGIAYLHSYVWVDAARSFQEALRRDPDLAMAELGLSKSYFNAEAYGDAFDHLKKAALLAAKRKVTPKEAKWISLGELQLEAIFAPPEARTRKHEEYKRAIEELIATDPSDAHAWVLRGHAEEARASGRGQGGGVGSIAFYEAALLRDPRHWGADHYLIHSYEGLGFYEKAAEHGRKYAESVTGVPHAQHMYAHVLPRLGRWQEAMTQLEKADRLQREYFDSGIAPVEEWHHGHNIHLLGTVHLRLGQAKEAEKYLREAFHLDVRSLRDGRFTDPWLELLLLQGRNDEALAAAREAQQRPLALARFFGSVRAAEALLALNRVDEAREALEQAKENLKQFEQAVAPHPTYDRLPRSYDETALRPLQAQFALLGPNPQEGEEVLTQLAGRFASEKGFDGWVTGIFRLQHIASFAQRVGRPQLAEVLREYIRRIDPTYTIPSSSAVAKN